MMNNRRLDMLKTPRKVKTMVKKSVEIPIMMANVPAIEKCNLEKLKALPRFGRRR